MRLGILQMSSQRLQYINFFVDEKLASVIRGMIVRKDAHHILDRACKNVVRKPWIPNATMTV